MKLLSSAVSSTIVEFKSAFVLNHQKGLIAAVADKLPGIGHRLCLRYIITDIPKKWGMLTRDQEAVIFAIGRSECENDFLFTDRSC